MSLHLVITSLLVTELNTKKEESSGKEDLFKISFNISILSFPNLNSFLRNCFSNQTRKLEYKISIKL
jgi:hypothetical protein